MGLRVPGFLPDWGFRLELGHRSGSSDTKGKDFGCRLWLTKPEAIQL